MLTETLVKYKSIYILYDLSRLVWELEVDSWTWKIFWGPQRYNWWLHKDLSTGNVRALQVSDSPFFFLIIVEARSALLATCSMLPRTPDREPREPSFVRGSSDGSQSIAIHARAVRFHATQNTLTLNHLLECYWIIKDPCLWVWSRVIFLFLLSFRRLIETKTPSKE